MDPNRDGYVSLQEYMAFMISKETENVQSSEEIENAFRAITNGERPYVTKEELYAVSLLLITHSNLNSTCISHWNTHQEIVRIVYNLQTKTVFNVKRYQRDHRNCRPPQRKISKNKETVEYF